jgi:hypothetical protein
VVSAEEAKYSVDKQQARLQAKKQTSGVTTVEKQQEEQIEPA